MSKNEEEHKPSHSVDYNCPFETARYLKIDVDYHDFPKKIYGLYAPALSTAHILINKHISLEKQEQVCEQFIAHHSQYKNDAPAYCIDHTTFLELEKKRNYLLNPAKLKNKIIPATN